MRETDLQTEQNKNICALLVYDAPQEKQSANTQELAGLVKTLGLHTCAVLPLARREAGPQYALGSGKVQEIIQMAQDAEADCIVFDFEITPTQQRNWERQAEIPVYDREEIILRIFAARARTKEAVLQVELARLQYSLPRLAHTYGDMARQRGGNYGSRGSGETQLELDRRAVMQKISQIKEDLRKVIKERDTMRKRREKTGVPSCAIVGYTNAGKSSLLNALTGAGIFTEDALFATLDPTTRKLRLSGGAEVLLTDTVGFIRNLPHTLVDSFRSTLEEATLADMILIVVDGSDMFFEEQYTTTITVLNEIGAGENPRAIVFNKCDTFDNNIFLKERVTAFCREYDALRISAKTGEGLQSLTSVIIEKLMGSKKNYLIPVNRSDLEALAHRTGIVEKSVWTENGIQVVAHTQGLTAVKLSEFEV